MMEFSRLQPRRLRKPNWSREEVNVLLRELQREARNLFGINASHTPVKTKAFIWQKIAANISALGVAPRTSLEVRLKWKGLKKDVLEKHKEQMPSGRGRRNDEEIVRAVIWDRCLCVGNQRCNRCQYSMATQQQSEAAPEKFLGNKSEVTPASATYPGSQVPMHLSTQARPDIGMAVLSEPVEGGGMAMLFQEGTHASTSHPVCPPVKSEPIEDVELVPVSSEELNASAPSAVCMPVMPTAGGGVGMAPLPMCQEDMTASTSGAGIPSAIQDRLRGLESHHLMAQRRQAVRFAASIDGRAETTVNHRTENSVHGRTENSVHGRIENPFLGRIDNPFLGRSENSVDGRAENSVDGQAESTVDDTADVNEDSALYREYLRSEIERNKSEVEKNKLLMQKMKKDMEDMEERKNREVAETNVKLFMYKTIQQTAMMFLRSKRPFLF